MKHLNCIFTLLFLLFYFPLEAQDSDIPLEGEGALAFLRRHQYVPATNYFDEFIRINRDKLGRDNTLFLDVSYELPSRTGTNSTNTNRQPPTQTKTRKGGQGLTREEIEIIKNKIAQDEHRNQSPDEHQEEHQEEHQNQSPDEHQNEHPDVHLDVLLDEDKDDRDEAPNRNENSGEPKPSTDSSLPSRIEPLFGKMYEEYSIEDRFLSGACFFLVSGHGGPDPGVTYNLGGRVLHEDEYAYDITLRLARNLLTHGATVHIIIQDPNDGIRDDEYLDNNDTETCMGEKISTHKEARLKQQCVEINNLSEVAGEKYQRAVFIHLESRRYSEQIENYFFHTKDSQSEKLAQIALNTFQMQYNKLQMDQAFKGTTSIRDLYVLRNTNPIAIYTELGNIRNRFDQKRLLISDNRQTMADWLAIALIEDYRNN
jgi:N-acetylmuramoyl-L-alanine amidase